MQKSEKLLIKHWVEFHPYKTSKTDLYYFRICELVRKTLNDPKLNTINTYVDEGEKNYFACYLTAYLEDVVSEAGIWTTFLKLHQKYYGKLLPFYPTEHDNYFEGEVNLEDIYFLIWYYISTSDKELLINPYSEDIIRLGERVFLIFEKEYEVAPENEKLSQYLKIENNDFYYVRSKINWFFINSYLFFPNKTEKESQLLGLFDKFEKLNYQQANYLVNEMTDNFTINHHSNLLALRGKDWLANLLGEEHPLYDDLLAISERKTGSFIYEKFDGQNIYMRHIASDTIIPVTKKSLVPEKADVPGETIFTMSVVKWQKEWWFSGMLAKTNYDEKLVEREKANLKAVNLFIENDAEKQEITEEQYRMFLEFNHNSPIAFFKNEDELDQFLKNFNYFWNKSHVKSGDDIPETNEMTGDLSSEEDMEEIPCLLFFNKKSGIEIVVGFNHIIPDPANKFYKEDGFEGEKLLHLITSDQYSKEFVLYLINNYNMPEVEFPDELKGSNLLKDNLDFIFRLYKGENYYSKPTITLI